MKKIIALMLSLLMIAALCACQKNEENGEVVKTITCTHEQAASGGKTIGLDVYDTWDAEAFDDGNYSGLCLSPKSNTCLKFRLYSCPDFGVCGTGLEEKHMTLGGYDACVGYYDGAECFDFIILPDGEDTFVVTRDYDCDGIVSDDELKSACDELLAMLDGVSIK